MPEEQLEYLVVTEPIPSGTTVIEKSVHGRVRAVRDLARGDHVLRRQSPRRRAAIHYELYGYLPGQYRTGPTVVRNAYRPEQLVVTAAKSLEVLPAGAAERRRVSADARRSCYELGKRHFDKDDLKTAQEHLAELVAELEPQARGLQATPCRCFWTSHLELGPPAQVVHYFEIVKEKWPTEEIPFDKIVKVAAAYHEMGEFERSYLVFRATVESSFRRESAVAGFLEAQGEFARSVDVMGRLLREYPPEAYVAAADLRPGPARLRQGPRGGRRRQAAASRRSIGWTWCVGRGGCSKAFLTAHPDDPAADQAAFAAANALLELKEYDKAAAACDRTPSAIPRATCWTATGT